MDTKLEQIIAAVWLKYQSLPVGWKCLGVPPPRAPQGKGSSTAT